MTLFKQGTLTFLSTIIANVALFGYYAIAAHVVGVVTYGALYTLLSLVTMLTLAAVILGTVVAKYAATFAAVGDEARRALLARRTLALVLAISAATLLCSVLLRSPIAIFLNLPNPNAVPLAILAFCTVFSMFVMRALLQGEQRFIEFSVAMLIESGGRLILGGGFILAGFGLEGALLGYALPSMFALLYVLRHLTFLPRVAGIDLFVDVRRLIATISGASVGLISIQVLYTADVLVAKHFFDGHLAGIYSAAALLGKTSFLALGFLPTILLPEATNQFVRGVLPIGALFKTLAAAIALSGAGMILVAVLGQYVVDIAFGKAFEAATPYLVPYLLVMSLLALSSILVAYRTAIHSFAFSLPLATTALGEILALVLFHSTISQLIWTLVAGNSLALLVCIPVRRPSRIDTVS